MASPRTREISKRWRAIRSSRGWRRESSARKKSFIRPSSKFQRSERGSAWHRQPKAEVMQALRRSRPAMSAPSSIKLLGISGSLRAQSYNSGALAVVGSVLADGMTFDVASLADLPFYNADVEQRGFPAAVESFRRTVAAADALIFAVPEYNFSVPGVLKNALEWLSRPPDSPTNGKPCAVFGASVSPLGTARSVSTSVTSACL